MIQARMSSSRYPKKMLEEIAGISLVEYVYNRCSYAKLADEVVILTSDDYSDDILYDECIDKNMMVYRGDLKNVLQRYVDASDYLGANLICRVCGDSPFVDVDSIDKMFASYKIDNSTNYMRLKGTLNGFISEVIDKDTLRQISSYKLSDYDKEHVTSYINRNKEQFIIKEIDVINDSDELRDYTLTIDYPVDMVVAKVIAERLDGFSFSNNQVIDELKRYSSI